MADSFLIRQRKNKFLLWCQCVNRGRVIFSRDIRQLIYRKYMQQYLVVAEEQGRVFILQQALESLMFQ